MEQHVAIKIYRIMPQRAERRNGQHIARPVARLVCDDLLALIGRRVSFLAGGARQNGHDDHRGNHNEDHISDYEANDRWGRSPKGL
ncbi:MAG: hypothetical protein B7Z22_00915 [Hyphomonas sp. 32-62-5]|nr:MAG: hypothetical protein B7Z22_00915 [Hyphomonas sp. 32-62-5]